MFPILTNQSDGGSTWSQKSDTVSVQIPFTGAVPRVKFESRRVLFNSNVQSEDSDLNFDLSTIDALQCSKSKSDAPEYALLLWDTCSASDCMFTIENIETGKILQLEIDKKEEKWWPHLIRENEKAFYAESEEETLQKENQKRMIKQLPAKIGEQTVARGAYTGGSKFAW